MEANHKFSSGNNNSEVIYIEDDAVSYKIVKSFLKNICEVDWAPNSSEALEKTASKKYKLILLDIHLPRGISGTELLKIFRSDPYYSEKPIIAVTAYAMLHEKLELLGSGFTDYISKPFTKSTLISTLEKYISSY